MASLVKDAEVAAAWRLTLLADASGVSPTLWACDEQTVHLLESKLDADLTGRPVSSTSRTFPGAAFGYMDGEVRLGYQLAEICLHTTLFGRQWLSAQHHQGNRSRRRANT